METSSYQILFAQITDHEHCELKDILNKGLWTVDYSITGYGLIKFQDVDLWTDVFEQDWKVYNREEAINHIPNLRKRGVENVVFAQDEVFHLLQTIRTNNTVRMYSFFLPYTCVLAELYPGGDLVKMISYELIASLTNKGCQVSRLFENFFTLLCQAEPTPDQMDDILQILHPSDVEKLNQLYGILSLFPHEQFFGIFNPLNSFHEDAQETASNLRDMTAEAREFLSYMRSSVTGLVERVNTAVSPGHPVFETLGVIGRIGRAIVKHLPYITGKIAIMILQGFSLERLIDLLAVTEILPILSEKFNLKISNLLFPPQEEIDLGKLVHTLGNIENLMTVWKIDRGITGAVHLVEYIQTALKKLGIISDKVTDELVRITRVMDDIEDTYNEYTRRRIENPRSLLDPSHLKILDAHLKDLSSMYGLLETTKNVTHRNRCALLKTQVRKLYTEVLTMQRQCNARPEPVGMCLLGAGGIGKSSILSQTPKIVWDRVAYRKTLNGDHPLHLDPDELVDSMKNWQSWAQNQSDQYASGYEQQEYHVVDDAFQDRDDKDHLAYFNLISSTPYPTNQAGLEAKGRPYTSRVILLSANHFPTRSETVRDVTALARRFQLIGVKFNGNQADYARFLNTPPEDFDNRFAHLQFYRMSGFDYVTNGQQNQGIGDQGSLWEPVSLDTYLDMIIDGVRAKQAIFQQRTHAQEEASSPDHTIDMGQWPCYFSPHARYFHTPSGDLIRNVTPADKTKSLERTLRTSYLGAGFQSQEFQTSWDINRVVACIKNPHTRHFGKMFHSDEPVTLFYEGAGVVTTLDLGILGPDFDPSNIIISQVPIADEKGCSDPPPDNTFYSYLKKLLTMFTGGCQILLDWLLYILKLIFLPDMTDWSILQVVLGTHWRVQVVIFAVSSLLGLFFGAQLLGNVPVCTGCAGDAQKNIDLIVQWILMNKVHDTHCGVFRCSPLCKELKEMRISYARGNCTHTTGWLLWKKPCAYSKARDAVPRMQNIIQELYAIDPDIVEPYFLAEDLVHKCGLPESEVAPWYNTILNTMRESWLIDQVFVHYGEEEMYQANLLIVDPASAEEESGESKRIVRKKATLESGESKRIIRKKATLESGESKKIIRRRAALESLYTNQTVKIGGLKGQAHRNLPGIFLEKEVAEELQTTHQPKTYARVAEEYGLRLAKINPHPIELQASEEASIDPNCRALALSVAECAVHVMHEDCQKEALKGIPVSSSTFVLPAHTTQLYAVGEEFPVIYKQTVRRARIVAVRPFWDIALAELVDGSQLVSQLSRIPTADELLDRLRANSHGMLAIPNRQNKGTSFLHVNMMLHQEYTVEFREKSKTYDHLWVARSMIGVGADTERGDCGSPAFLMCSKTAKKLVGFHIVGSPRFSAFAVLTQERVAELHDALSPRTEEEIDISAIPSTFPIVENEISKTIEPSSVEDPLYLPVGEEKTLIGTRTWESPSNGRTAIQKHPCYGVFEVDTKPAYLSYQAWKVENPDKELVMENPEGDTVELNLITANTSKWCKKLPTDPLITEELKEMEEQLTSYWLSVFDSEDLSPITLAEAVSGIPAAGLEPMNLKSSPGIPLNRAKDAHSKASLVEPTGKVLCNGAIQKKPIKEVEEATLRRLKLATEGKRAFSIWKDCLKDETRPVEKANKGKTRIFTAAPFDFSLAVRVILGKFKAAWLKHGHLLGHAVGTDCMSVDWSDLYKRLKTISNFGLDCDFSSYDGNLRADFMFAAIRIFAKVVASRCFTSVYGISKENIEQVIQVICSECVETIQQSVDTVWMSHHGNPSGNPLTTELNCTVNFMYHWFCFRQILGADKCDLKTFMERVGFVCFGDDAAYVFQDVEKVTFEKMRHWMAFLGQDYTNAAKTDENSGLLQITELSFLKRTFRPTDGGNIVYSPIEKASITGQFNWCSYGEDAVEILQDTFENALLEMSQHGRIEFENFVSKLHPVINNHLRQISGVVVPRPSYKAYRHKLTERFTK